jgi:Tol biopolymer transport system component
VKVRPDGTVKILDFGLAKALEETPAPGSINNSPTISAAASREGMILGTAAYMSPEQARGKTVDRRCDIWSFGAVLFEILSGKQPFSGEDVSHTLAAVIMGEPDWNALPATTPSGIQRLVRRCLNKDPRQRLRDIGEARIAIEGTLTGSSDVGVGLVPVLRRPQAAPLQRALPWVLAVISLLVLLGRSFLHFRETKPAERVLRYTLVPPGNSTVHSFAVSPDGHYVAITAAMNGRRQLWLRALDGLQAEPMAGTEDATYPFWSPDSRYIAFFAQGKLKKIAASGGPAQSLCNASDGRGGSWSRIPGSGDETIVFSPGPSGGIQRVPAAGGVPSEVIKTGSLCRYPFFLPNGDHFLYTDIGGLPEKNGVYLSSLDGKENRRVLADISSVVFAAGRLLFVRENTLMAQSFDAGTGQVSGEALPIAERVSLNATFAFAMITVSENGVLLYASASSTGPRQIVWFDRAGKLLGSFGAPGFVAEPSISPDEKRVAFRRSTGSTSDIWLRDVSRGTDTRFTFDASSNLDPSWSPKGDRVVFNSNRGGPFNLYQTSGSGQDELLVSTANVKVPDQWSRDGRFVVYSEQDPKTKYDLWVLPVGAGAPRERKPIQFLHTEFNELYGQLSPDSRWMAYTSDESGQREVYVRPFPAAEGKWRISTAGGEQPRWRGDGRELFFVGGDGKMTAVAVEAVAGTKASFQPGAPVPLFETHIGEGSGHVAFQYDVTADGKRFVLAMNVPTASAAPTPPLIVVVNWNSGLRK